MKKNDLHQILIEIGQGIAHGVGYDNLLEMMLSVFSVRYWLVFLESIAFSLVFTVAICSTQFVETYLYAPYLGLIIFNILIGLETLSGTYVKVSVNKERFDLGKFLRGTAMKPVGQNAVLFVAFNMGILA
jgi:hypothetical protein